MKDQKTLTREEMKNVTGGYAAPAFNCQCTGSVGTWTGHYSSAQAIANDIAATCRSGQGTCTAANPS